LHNQLYLQLQNQYGQAAERNLALLSAAVATNKNLVEVPSNPVLSPESEFQS
jgi:hypothetical protein